MLVLAFDAGGPFADAALARDGVLIAELRVARDGARGDLLRTIAALIDRESLAPGALDGIVALIGPGSFTGTRVACSAALGLAAATGAPATGVPTLEALALCAPDAAGQIVAVVDAMRGEWFVQRFARSAGGALAATGEAAILRPEGVDLTGVERIVGFEAARFAAAARTEIELVDRPEPSVAAARAATAGRWPWDPSRLAHPLHLRAPAVSGKR